MGSVEKEKQSLWLLNPERTKMVFQSIEYVPALFKIFDEIIVNAADNYSRS